MGWLDESFPENFKKKMNDYEKFEFRISDICLLKNQQLKVTKLLGVENNKGELALSEDWIIYYLRKKALYDKISFAELARITYIDEPTQRI